MLSRITHLLFLLCFPLFLLGQKHSPGYRYEGSVEGYLSIGEYKYFFNSFYSGIQFINGYRMTRGLTVGIGVGAALEERWLISPTLHLATRVDLIRYPSGFRPYLNFELGAGWERYRFGQLGMGFRIRLSPRLGLLSSLGYRLQRIREESKYGWYFEDIGMAELRFGISF